VSLGILNKEDLLLIRELVGEVERIISDLLEGEVNKIWTH
jgi:hypothetical protein